MHTLKLSPKIIALHSVLCTLHLNGHFSSRRQKQGPDSELEAQVRSERRTIHLPVVMRWTPGDRRCRGWLPYP
jgi:hypothetical protein